jgi:hypothetical protein
MTPKPPKVVEPKDPIAAKETVANTQTTRPQGRASLVSAGTLTKKPFTIKASLLGE